MSRRHLRLARVRMAAGLVGGILLGLSHGGWACAADESTEPVSILKAQRDGQLELVVRGQGEDRVRFEVKNTTPQRLRVVLPPGLVAVAATGQPGFQSMGLGTPTTTPGSFGQFQAAPTGGFRSIPVSNSSTEPEAITIPADAKVSFTIPSVCLNYGIPTPTPRDQFRLADVDEYTQDPRARKALRSLATLGTSQTVAQSVAWIVFNGMSPSQLLAQNAKRLNTQEVALASRIAEAIDASGDDQVINPEALRQGRILVRLRGTGEASEAATRIRDEIDGSHLLGLPIRVVDAREIPTAATPSLLIDVELKAAGSGTRGNATIRVNQNEGGWRQLAALPIDDEASVKDLASYRLIETLDRSIARNFVSVKTGRKTADSTTFRLENRLPFSIARAVVQTGPADRSSEVTLPALGIAPLRATQVSLPTGRATIDRVELNGL